MRKLKRLVTAAIVVGVGIHAGAAEAAYYSYSRPSCSWNDRTVDARSAYLPTSVRIVLDYWGNGFAHMDKAKTIYTTPKVRYYSDRTVTWLVDEPYLYNLDNLAANTPGYVFDC